MKFPGNRPSYRPVAAVTAAVGPSRPGFEWLSAKSRVDTLQTGSTEDQTSQDSRSRPRVWLAAATTNRWTVSAAGAI